VSSRKTTDDDDDDDDDDDRERLERGRGRERVAPREAPGFRCWCRPSGEHQVRAQGKLEPLFRTTSEPRIARPCTHTRANTWRLPVARAPSAALCVCDARARARPNDARTTMIITSKAAASLTCST
jgi:hypothetical protein